MRSYEDHIRAVDEHMAEAWQLRRRRLALAAFAQNMLPLQQGLETFRVDLAAAMTRIAVQLRPVAEAFARAFPPEDSR